jgi:uracil-DNA glycosylase family 4
VSKSNHAAPSRHADLRLAQLASTVVSCHKCPRLVSFREHVARAKRRAYRDWTNWGRPVPGFGDPHAALLIVGLAPGAHGANRTGRMFTGDRSGDFLYAQLHRAGFATQPVSIHLRDGLVLRNAYISAAVRCAPPDNKPLPSELDNCAAYLQQEFEILKPRAVLALGSIAFHACLRLFFSPGHSRIRVGYKFAHAAEYELPDGLPRLFASYHPSQQNTQTGRLTADMFSSVLKRIRRILAAPTTPDSRPRPS